MTNYVTTSTTNKELLIANGFNEIPGRSKLNTEPQIIVDTIKKNFWLIDAYDLNNAQFIAQERDNQMIGHIQSAEIKILLK